MCRLWKQAYYNASNCEALVSCAPELQGLVLANTSLAARPTLMANLLEAVTEVKEFIATFSERSVPFIILSACLPAYLYVVCLCVCKGASCLPYMRTQLHLFVRYVYSCVSVSLFVSSVCISICLSVCLPACPRNSMHSQCSPVWLCRGWLSRLEKVSSDKEEFCRLDRLLISVAVEGGNQPGPEQVGYLFTHMTHAESALFDHA